MLHALGGLCGLFLAVLFLILATIARIFYMIFRIATCSCLRSSSGRKATSYTTASVVGAAAAAADAAAPLKGSASLLVRSPTRHVVDIDGVRTEFLEWPAEGKEQADRVVVFFPGNPGTPHFYTDFLGAHHAHSGGRAHVYCIGHSGHSVATVRRPAATLRDQLAHKHAALRHVLARHPVDTRVVLGGHSVGAFCAMDALHSASSVVPPERIAQVWLLFPTLTHIVDTPNGRKLLPIFTYYRPAAWLATAAICMLPRPLRVALLRLGIPQLPPGESDALAAAESLLHPHVAYSALTMALHEMREIRDMAPHHAAALRAVEERVVLYFAAEDGWVSPASAAAVSAALPRARTINCTEGHQHAFVLHPRSNEHLAAASWEWLRTPASPTAASPTAASSSIVTAAAPSDASVSAGVRKRSR